MKSFYGRDPDGNEFEVMWMLRREQWGEFERRAIAPPLDFDREPALPRQRRSAAALPRQRRSAAVEREAAR